MAIKKVDEYKVKDLYAAAYLYAQGVKLLRLQQQSLFYFFVFSNVTACEQLCDDYWSYKGIVEPKKYADSIKSLKDLIFSRGSHVK